ncbi:aspartate dehydrogenase [Prosthecomicrobium hirschii]|uniref:aspartate dehydrogenase domain-containing protein n=1 Tax=Prosthecodimorpha hirschii TaxID=665126 RepID=UPI001126A87D|nr:aspartate dehydrogenase domain-containing protein [Prosthecomicrobium hirschii]TPQ49114.1 aspartate dehydrogenase [Prosthecomicrobium hirschii]
MPGDAGRDDLRAAGPRPRLRCALLGYGRIGRLIAAGLAARPDGPELVGILTRGSADTTADPTLPDPLEAGLACAALDDLVARRPDMVVECASTAALVGAAPVLLAAGIDVIPLSLAAFADPAGETVLRTAADRGPGRILVPSGAVGALGLLAAAAAAGLDSVRFVQSYPPAVWRRTPAAAMVDLDRLDGPVAFFRGSARAAARLFPHNLNAATGIALAGLGLDATEVELIADPNLPGVRYELAAEAATGPIRLVIGPRPDPGPDLTAYSVLALLAGRAAAIAL